MGARLRAQGAAVFASPFTTGQLHRAKRRKVQGIGIKIPLEPPFQKRSAVDLRRILTLMMVSK